MQNILSVGIDVGTSTTQLVFSRIAMENTSGYFSVPRISVTSKEVIYKSDIYLTPLKTDKLIDGEAIRHIIAREYSKAGYKPENVDTGAVIVTGESSRKENAEEVLRNLSCFAGDFVVSTAGPDLESIIAGKGSGAYQYSIENDCVVINMDIGGGTTNIVVFDGGETVSKTCFDIGGRLIKLSKDRVIEYVSPSAAKIAASIGVQLQEGEPCRQESLEAVTDKMAQLLAQSISLSPSEKLLYEIQSPESSVLDMPKKKISKIFFSGGVADCIENEKAAFAFDDIGVLLGRSIRKSLLYSSGLCAAGRETIRATVVGAGTYTTSISGSTITYASEILPIKNIPALKLTAEEQGRCFDGDGAFLTEKMRWFMRESSCECFVLAMSGISNPGYSEIKTLAHCLGESFNSALKEKIPALVVIEQDMAKALGLFLEAELESSHRLVCIDGIKVEQGDYVDIGRGVMSGLVIPVVVKTLLFG
ncbi:MAG: ethanolamine ammonia-lyase reactivating factor EutA [Clostridium sp.]|nr:ethanolamine ammonia-lyase reactivating factor EutA [Clostridium sp.]